jgi:hypothetical protein
MVDVSAGQKTRGPSGISKRASAVKLARWLLTASPPLGACISSLDKTALNFAIYGRTRPGKTPVSTAVSPRY